jgi:hypothetical protein
MPAKVANKEEVESGRSWDLLPRKSTSGERVDVQAHKAEEYSFVASMLAGASAGIVARLPCHPIDTIKAKLQVDIGSGGSFWRTLRTTVRAEGVPGLYRGIGAHNASKICVKHSST